MKNCAVFRLVLRRMVLLILIVLLLPLRPGLAGEARAPGAAAPPVPSAGEHMGEEELLALAPLLVQIVNLAEWDPQIAANLVPEVWIGSAVEGALEVEAEVPVKTSTPDSPQDWPIGPWTTPASLAATIREAEPRAVASLYSALKPRLANYCRQRKASLARCDTAIRRALGRFSAPAVLTRSVGGATAALSPITSTQRELARLGPPVVVALRDRLQVLGQTIWGDAWNATQLPPRAPRE